MDLESTVHSLAPRLVAFCLGCTGSRTVAEDAAQDALVALVQRWRRNGRPASPEAFAFAIARRRARRALFRRRLLYPLHALLDRNSDEPSPEAQATDRDELTHTLRGIRELRREDREALLLAAVAEVESPAGARLLGISQEAFRMRVHRARRRLAAHLEGRHARP